MKSRGERITAITERGGHWRSTMRRRGTDDALQTANPKTTGGSHYLAKKEMAMTVVFGALNADRTKFLISYEATQLDKPSELESKGTNRERDEEFYCSRLARWSRRWRFWQSHAAL